MSELSWTEACIRALYERDWISDGLAEDLRQHALERDLGQVRCPHAHASGVNSDQCPGCGAAL